MADVLRKLKYSVIRNHLKKYILALLDLNWNMVVIFGITVTKEIRKKLEDFQLSIARTVTGARKGTIKP